MAETVTLEFLADQNGLILNEIVLIREDIEALRAMLLRFEETTAAMVDRNTRLLDQLRTIEQRVT